jgi:hypothetical protein
MVHGSRQWLLFTHRIVSSFMRNRLLKTGKKKKTTETTETTDCFVFVF